MELSIRIELSDEQYNLLMQNSYDEIFKNPETLDQLRQIIISNFAEYFSGSINRNPNNFVATSPDRVRNFVEKALLKEVRDDANRSSYTHTTHYEPTEFMRQLVDDATKDQRKEFESKIQLIVESIFRNSTLVSKILRELLINSIRNGITMGNDLLIDMHQKEKEDEVMMIYDVVKNMMNNSSN